MSPLEWPKSDSGWSLGELACTNLVWTDLANVLPRLQQERVRLLSQARLAVLYAVMAAREALESLGDEKNDGLVKEM